MMGTEWDNAALEVYRKAMPGYVVMGFTGNWFSTDAIHCRVHEMVNRQMIRIKHVPIKGAQVNQTQFNLEASIKAYSGKPLNNDSLLVYYKVGSEAWKTLRFLPKSGDTYSAQLPLAAKDQTVQYYLFASDLAGKRSTLPVVGASAPFVFATGDNFTENQVLQTRPTTKIYPNPVNDWLAVSMENEPNDQTIRMEVYSANGQLIKTIKEPVSENIFLDFRSFKTGIYTLRIIGTNGAEIFKVVKK